MEARNKDYYLPGDVVTIRQDVPNKPTMIVVKKSIKRFNSENFFQGILCQWFSTDMKLQESVFNTKDLIKVN